MNRNHTPLAFAALALFVVLAVTMPCVDAFAAPVRVRVRGAAKISARASRDQTATGLNELVLSGSLSDDVGQPLPVQRVVIRIEREGAPDDGSVAEALRTPRGCDVGGRAAAAWSVQPGGPREVIATTDEDGRFCMRARLDPPDRYKATLVYSPPPASPYVDAAQRELTFDLLHRSLALRFDPPPRILQLDTPRAQIDAVAIADDDGAPRVAPGLLLVLTNEKEELARSHTDDTGRARFVLPGSKLGPPGKGELRLAFAGDVETSRAEHVEDVERHVKVSIAVPAAERGELSPGVPEDGIPLLAEVTSSLGPIAEGSVEARVGEIVVGAAPVERGLARLTLTFAAQGTEARVRLRYVPASPWFEPLSTEPTIRVPLREPSLLSKAPILIAGLAVLALFLVGRVSGQKNKPGRAPAPLPETREAKPSLEVIRRAENGDAGWTGRVLDAHEDTPVAGARVWIERGTFEGRTVLASVQTDDSGRFTLASIGPVAGNETIAAEARLHARLVQELPLPGEVAIALAQRRRALLGRLVTWARRRGPPFDLKPEPTPGHVRRAASGELATARWAEAVERVAFGPGEVDARTEQEVEQLQPDGANGASPGEPVQRR